LAIAGIHLSDIPSLNYDIHLFQEKRLHSVTANTRADGEAFLKLAAQIPVKVTTVPYGFEEADRALSDLAHDRFTGAAVLMMDSTTSNQVTS
ncbi:MAG: zinc-binding alcohol dehydrogenase family protein, partial [Acidimicrobiaceae bacterium]|nr:zinc-binding alcohol dehydrogenase family protein [Acidimicrobiaceae bacterium]